MVDAAASTVFHSFFTSTSRIVLSKPSSSKITLDAVVKVVKREAIPRARAVVAVLARSNPDRAEEVPLDEQCRKWLVEYGSHHQLFATTHPLWCTDRDRLFMWKEIVPRRSNFISSAISSLFSLPRFSHSISTALFRYASTAASSNSAPSPAQDPLDYLHEDTLTSRYFRPEEGWAAYSDLRRSDRLSQLSWQHLMRFGERIIELVEGVDSGADPDPPRQWGLRLSEFLQDLQLRKLGDPTSTRERLLAARASALRGDVAGAVKKAKETYAQDKEAAVSVRAIYGSCFLSTWRNVGPLDALNFMEHHWMYFKSAIYKRPDVRERDEVKSLRKHIRAFVFLLEDPITLLSERAESWTPKRLQKTARLLVNMMCQEGRPEDALAIDSFLQRRDLTLPTPVRCGIAQAFAKNDTLQASELFRAITQNATEEDLQSTAYLVAGLHIAAGQGDEEDAHKFYSALSSPTMGEKVLLMSACAHNRNVKEVVRLFHEWFAPAPDGTPAPHTPNIVHYSNVIYAHTQAEDFDGMNQWLAHMAGAGIRADRGVYEVVLRSFAMRGDVESVSAIFDQMRQARVQPSVISYTTAMRLLANRRQPATVEMLYKRAISDGIKPDRLMLTTLMNAHVEAGEWRGVIRVFDYFRAQKIKLTIEVFNTLIKAYVLIGTPFRVLSGIAQRLGDHNIKPDERTYALLIQSACDANDMDVARDLFYEMDDLAKSGQYDIEVNVYAMTIIMAGYLRRRDVETATKVFDDMRERGIMPTALTYANVVRAYAGGKTVESIQLARRFMMDLLKDEDRRDQWLKTTFGRPTSYDVLMSPLMSAYVDGGTRTVKKLERLVENHALYNGPPTVQMLTFLLDVYRHRYIIEGVERVWPQILELSLPKGRGQLSKPESQGDYAASHDLAVPLSLYIEIQSIAGRHEKVVEAWGMLKSRGFVFTSHNWNHLVLALIRGGEVERAFEVVESVLLPRHKQMAALIRQRSKNPESPLLMDTPPLPDEEDEKLASLPTDPPLHDRYLRRKAVAESKRRLGQWYTGNEDEDDLAEPLHMLNQVSPTWNVWRPHTATLKGLHSVFKRLNEGLPVRAWPRRDKLSKRIFDEPIDYDESKVHAEAAKELLAHVRYRYPRTVHLLREYEERAARKATRMNFRRLNQQVRENITRPADDSTWVYTPVQ